MKFDLRVSPLSNNKAWKGKHFKTRDYKDFEIDVCKTLPFAKEDPIAGEIFVHYIYHIKTYGNSDTGNMEKTLTDMLVKRNYLKDDRYIRAIYQRKERVSEKKDEYIEIRIEPYTGQDIN